MSSPPFNQSSSFLSHSYPSRSPETPRPGNRSRIGTPIKSQPPSPTKGSPRPQFRSQPPSPNKSGFANSPVTNSDSYRQREVSSLTRRSSSPSPSPSRDQCSPTVTTGNRGSGLIHSQSTTSRTRCSPRPSAHFSHSHSFSQPDQQNKLVDVTPHPPSLEHRSRSFPESYPFFQPDPFETPSVNHQSWNLPSVYAGTPIPPRLTGGGTEGNGNAEDDEIQEIEPPPVFRIHTRSVLGSNSRNQRNGFGSSHREDSIGFDPHAPPDPSNRFTPLHRPVSRNSIPRTALAHAVQEDLSGIPMSSPQTPIPGGGHPRPSSKQLGRSTPSLTRGAGREINHLFAEDTSSSDTTTAQGSQRVGQSTGENEDEDSGGGYEEEMFLTLSSNFAPNTEEEGTSGEDETSRRSREMRGVGGDDQQTNSHVESGSIPFARVPSRHRGASFTLRDPFDPHHQHPASSSSSSGTSSGDLGDFSSVFKYLNEERQRLGNETDQPPRTEALANSQPVSTAHISAPINPINPIMIDEDDGEKVASHGTSARPRKVGNGSGSASSGSGSSKTKSKKDRSTRIETLAAAAMQSSKGGKIPPFPKVQPFRLPIPGEDLAAAERGYLDSTDAATVDESEDASRAPTRRRGSTGVATLRRRKMLDPVSRRGVRRPAPGPSALGRETFGRASQQKAGTATMPIEIPDSPAPEEQPSSSPLRPPKPAKRTKTENSPEVMDAQSFDDLVLNSRPSSVTSLQPSEDFILGPSPKNLSPETHPRRLRQGSVSEDLLGDISMDEAEVAPNKPDFASFSTPSSMVRGPLIDLTDLEEEGGDADVSMDSVGSSNAPLIIHRTREDRVLIDLSDEIEPMDMTTEDVPQFEPDSEVPESSTDTDFTRSSFRPFSASSDAAYLSSTTYATSVHTISTPDPKGKGKAEEVLHPSNPASDPNQGKSQGKDSAPKPGPLTAEQFATRLLSQGLPKEQVVQILISRGFTHLQPNQRHNTIPSEAREAIKKTEIGPQKRKVAPNSTRPKVVARYPPSPAIFSQDSPNNRPPAPRDPSPDPLFGPDSSQPKGKTSRVEAFSRPKRPLHEKERQRSLLEKIDKGFPEDAREILRKTRTHGKTYAGLFGVPQQIRAQVKRAEKKKGKHLSQERIGPSAPGQHVTEGFWPALNSELSQSTAPSPESEPHLEIFIDHSNVMYSFLNYVRDQERRLGHSIFSGDDGPPPPGVSRQGFKGHKPLLDYTTLFALLERGRTVMRRVLVASSPLHQGLEAAFDWGYEVSVLQRVLREVPAPSLPFGTGGFKQRRNNRNLLDPTEADADSTGNESDAIAALSRRTSGKATGQGMKAARKAGAFSGGFQPRGRDRVEQVWKEQAVDEVIQMKILESIVDYDGPAEPPPTLVLVSGDGAASEFTPQGFLAPIRRALKRGWNVEIVAFGKFTSQNWYGEEARGRGGERPNGGKITMIALENYADELLAMDERNC